MRHVNATQAKSTWRNQPKTSVRASLLQCKPPWTWTFVIKSKDEFIIASVDTNQCRISTIIAGLWTSFDFAWKSKVPNINISQINVLQQQIQPSSIEHCHECHAHATCNNATFVVTGQKISSHQRWTYAREYTYAPTVRTTCTNGRGVWTCGVDLRSLSLLRAQVDLLYFHFSFAIFLCDVTQEEMVLGSV